MTSVDKKAQLKEMMKKSMKERVQNKKQKIDSPYAVYNSSGLLVCTLCNVPLKTEALWGTHCATESHKQNLLAGSRPKPTPLPIPKSITSPSPSSTASSHTNASNPLTSTTTTSTTTTEISKPDLSTTVISRAAISAIPVISADLAVLGGLPEGFFDNKEKEAYVQQKLQQDKGVPDGFFDGESKTPKSTTEGKSNAVGPKEDLNKAFENFEAEISLDLQFAEQVELERAEKQLKQLEEQEQEQQKLRKEKMEALKNKSLECKEKMLHEKKEDSKKKEVTLPEKEELEEEEELFFNWRSSKVHL